MRTKFPAIDQPIKATEIQPGMIVDIYGDTERVMVQSAKANGYGAVLISDGIDTWGLSIGETVTVKGYFNPDN